MISEIISKYKIWRLKREIKSIDSDIEDFYVILMSRNDEFQSKIDIDKHYQKFIKLRTIEKAELLRQIKNISK